MQTLIELNAADCSTGEEPHDDIDEIEPVVEERVTKKRKVIKARRSVDVVINDAMSRTQRAGK